MPELLVAERPVTDVPAAEPRGALAYFLRSFPYETDCSDVYTAFEEGHDGFVVLDVRSPELYAREHLPGAANLPAAGSWSATLPPIPRTSSSWSMAAGRTATTLIARPWHWRDSAEK